MNMFAIILFDFFCFGAICILFLIEVYDTPKKFSPKWWVAALAFIGILVNGIGAIVN